MSLIPKALLIAITTVTVSSWSQVMATDNYRTAIKQLDHALGMREKFISERQNLIDSLKEDYRSRPGADSEQLMKIGNAYSSFANDSAIHYFHSAIEDAADQRERREAIMRRAELLPLAGLYEAADKTYSEVDTAGMTREELQIYHETGRQLYSYLAAAFEDFPNYSDRYVETALSHQRRLLELLNQQSEEYIFNLGEYYFLKGENIRAKALLEQLTAKSTDKGLLARAWHHLATMANAENNREAYINALARSAVADIESATLEVKSLQEIGAAMYAEGDIERAYNYLAIALDNAVRCGATLRMIESSRVLPIIGNAHNQQAAEWRKWLYIIMAVMGVMVAGLGVSLYLRYRQMKRLDNARRRLRVANQSKDVYISRFLQLCSIYMDKLNQFCKIAERKISAGKTDELYRMTKSGKFIEEQSADFYNVFDDAFLHLYPDFVAQVNELLRPECRITLEDGERLNTDLRILAITRMGIDDAASIAQILNYSLNTIYSYRNRLKSRAIDRDNFENDIMKISSEI
ncbi:MAG: hypothetical protein K2J12_06655 [Muribaculaceae bacterium]|nr:hypothetical protein [Muribaculaceae bacterium]